MTFLRAWFAAGAVCVLAFSASSARAAPSVPDTSEARADALFRQGTEMLDEGHVDEACEALTQSLRLDVKLGTLLNLGLCHEKQGKSATAWAEFSEAAAWAADAGQADRRDFAHQHAATLERSLVRLQLHLPAGDRMVVEIDGDAIAESRRLLPLFVDPGHHALRVTAPGKKPYIAEIDAAPATGAHHEGASQAVSVPPLADETPVPSFAAASVEALSRPNHASNRGRAVALGLGAASVVGLVVGVFFGAETLSDLGTASGHCSAMGCDAQGLAAHDRAKGAEVASMVTFGASLLALGAGAWLWVSAPPALSAEGSRGGVRVVPMVSEGSRGVNVIGTW